MVCKLMMQDSLVENLLFSHNLRGPYPGGIFWPVKLSIKSFIVPELFIEVAESATIGSLKVLFM